jgi:DNA-binding HxlR family transcriptional regulator
LRTGSNALSMLAVPLNVQVLEALDEHPLALADLRRRVGHPPVTTMRSYLRRLTELKVVDRRQEADFPGSVSYAITGSGKNLLAVAAVLRRWLEEAPDGPIEFGDRLSRSAVKALVDGWDTGIVRALAARSLSLTELDRVIPTVTYPALERRLTAMRQMGLVEPDPERNGRVVRCRATNWLRRAVAPLSAGVGWEQRSCPHAVPPGKLDAEAALLLVAPLLALPPELEGSCRLAVEFRQGSELAYAGAMLTVAEGEVASCVSRLEGSPDAWVSGPVVDWFRWVRGADHRIESGGEMGLVRALAGGFRDALRIGTAARAGQ